LRHRLCRNDLELDHTFLYVIGIALLRIQISLERARIKNDRCPRQRERLLLANHAVRVQRIHFEVGENLVHDSRIDLLAGCGIPKVQRIEAQVPGFVSLFSCLFSFSSRERLRFAVIARRNPRLKAAAL
jgi:hypothetical protein